MSQGGLAPQRTLRPAGPVSAAPALGPRDDLGAVYEAHYQVVYRAVRGVVLDPHLAEDVTQDAFVKAYRARLRYRLAGSVEAWLCLRRRARAAR